MNQDELDELQDELTDEAVEAEKEQAMVVENRNSVLRMQEIIKERAEEAKKRDDRSST